MDIRIDNLENMRAACMEHIGPYNEIGPVFGKLWSFTQENSIPVDDQKWLGIYWDDPSDVLPEKLRSEACVTVCSKTEIPDTEGLTIRTLEGGKYAIGTYVGPYSGLGSAWGEIDAAVKKMEAKPRQSPCFELYVKGGDDSIPEEEWITELCIPVE